MQTNHRSRKNLLADPSLWFLLLSNFVTIFFAIKENWDFPTLIWIYLLQSVIIGFFNFIRIFQLKEFSTEGYTIDGKPVPPTQGTKNYTAFFFLFHYGFFHFMYAMFLLIDPFSFLYEVVPYYIEWGNILPITLLFFFNHLFSCFYNKPKNTKRVKIGMLMFYPYARIIPMHLTMLLGPLFSGALLLFLILKTFADALMHAAEHSMIRKDESQ